jgi:coproporphyrinogen III oxidase-like Fe-S oxidoreductase
LIYGIHKQGPSEAVRDLELLLETGITHLSAYTLTIEPGTRFGALAARGKLPLLEEEIVACSYEAVSHHMTSVGFRHYEVSNFARPGAESVHNMGYWQGRDYLGVGTGAFGTVTLEHERVRYKNILSPERYMDVWSKGRVKTPFSEQLSERETIPPDVAHQEALLLGLRTEAGIDLAEVATLRGGDPFTPERRRSIEQLRKAGRLAVDGTRLRIPGEHWLLSDGIIRDLL